MKTPIETPKEVAQRVCTEFSKRQNAAGVRLEAIRRRETEVEQDLADAAARGDDAAVASLESEMAVLPSAKRAAEIALDGITKAHEAESRKLTSIVRAEQAERSAAQAAEIQRRAEVNAAELRATAGALGRLMLERERLLGEHEGVRRLAAQYGQTVGGFTPALDVLAELVSGVQRETRNSAEVREIRIALVA